MNIGVYVHLPFCKSRCSYCDFYSQTDLSLEDDCLTAINRELAYLGERYARIWTETLYLGGGTPSLLKTENLFWLVYNIFQTFPSSKMRCAPEITIELNPDDVTDSKLEAYRNIGINRISLGLQTFSDKLLRLINRRHNSNDSWRALEKIRQAGFDNLSIDLIFAIPGQSLENIKKDLEQVLMFSPEHISIYCLTFEPGTRFFKLLSEGKLKPQDDQSQAIAYRFISDYLQKQNYQHYEISNFCLRGKECRHNLNYWHCGNYIGLGAAAHSHIGDTRWSNCNDLHEYIRRLSGIKSAIAFEEKLDQKMMAEELVLMSLRLREGLNLKLYKKISGKNMLQKKSAMVNQLIENGLIELAGDQLRLTAEGFLLADQIILELS